MGLGCGTRPGSADPPGPSSTSATAGPAATDGDAGLGTTTQPLVCDTCPRPCVGSPNCRLPNGCSGQRDCDDGVWSACYLIPSSTKGCTATCGNAGTQACNADGSFGQCNATTCCPNKGAACVASNNCNGLIDCNGNCAAVPGPGPACTSTLGFPGHYACTLSLQNLGCQPDNQNQQYEVCNGLDDDADGVIDNAVGSRVAYSMTTGCSVPGSGCNLPGTQTCNGGVPSACVVNPTCTNAYCEDYGYKGKPGCLNGQYFCDFSVNTTGTPAPACTTFCGTAGTVRCWGPSARGGCQAPEGCNNCDDDADGFVDNEPGSNVNGSLKLNCTNRCGDAVQRTCVTSCPERPELCNGLDDNCDGNIDESDVCRQDASCPAVP